MIGSIAPALLEDWLRHRYFQATLDISSSGVDNYSLGDLRRMLGITSRDLDDIVFRDSPSVGGPELVSALAERYAPGREDHVLVTHGASESIFLLMAALLRPGDEIVALRPIYQSLSSIAESLGARCVPWELSADDDFAPQLDGLRAVLRPTTRMVVVNFPHNPTGASLDARGRAELVELLADHPAYLVWDGSMADLSYDEVPLPDPALALARGVSIGTFSKAYGLPGLRVGWCFAPPAVVREMVRVRDYTTLSTSPLTESIAAAVVRQADVVLRPKLVQANENRAILLEWMTKHADLVSCPPPVGGVAAFPRFLTIVDTRPFCEDLLRERSVLTVPGDCFGHPDRVRIGFGGPTTELVAGLAELADLLARWPSG
jgi:capreomycidine synthase